MNVPPSPSEVGPVLSVVVPFLNEEAVLDRTYCRLKTELDRLGESYELIFVDDGSTDRSRAILASHAQCDPALRIVVLSRNFGHEMAITAGLQSARGRAAIVMDADLQDPPEMIGQFLDRWREGYQVVYGVRQERRGESVFKKTTSFLFYRVLSRFADVSIPADTGDFRLMDRSVLDTFCRFHEDPRFFRGLISWIGFRQIGVPFVRHGRAGGQSKYHYLRLFRLALDTLTAFSTLPSLCLTLLACALAVSSFAFIAVVVVLQMCGQVALEGWMWAALGFLVLWNVQFLSLATLGEYIIRTHRHTQRRPLFVIDQIIECPIPVSDPCGLPVLEREETLVCHPSALCKT